ncbi:hypothetical protein [Anaerovibrio sp. RM50]|uniref:hypothetical protein n=1 Tax=Anaerovibrio sp. RM50 TaxID=1200557 RepID=UPI0012EB878C|nr:hypothetical protein [Anaerovibrio sp. RM50]
MLPLFALAPVAMTAVEAFSAGVGIGIALHETAKKGGKKHTAKKDFDKEEGDTE